MASRIVVKYQGKTYIGDRSSASVKDLAENTADKIAEKATVRLKLVGGDVLVLGTEATQRAAFIVQAVNDEPNSRAVSEKEAEA